MTQATMNEQRSSADSGNWPPLWWLPAILFALPTFTALASYWISQGHDLVPRCCPFLHGCSSVSAAGRNPPAIFLFRAGVIPGAVLLMAYWLLTRAWLRSLSHNFRLSQALIPIIGIVGAVFLILYAVFLGSQGDFYRFMRRIGVIVYFATTFFAQLLQARVLIRLSQTAYPDLLRLSRWKFRICILLFTLGIGSIPIMNFIDNKDQLQNVLEWNYLWIMYVYFIISALMWRKTQFKASFFSN